MAKDTSISDQLLQEQGMLQAADDTNLGAGGGDPEPKDEPGAGGDPEPKPKPEGGVDPGPSGGSDDIDEEKLLAYLQKKNPKITSLKDVLGKQDEPTEEERQQAEEAKKSEVLKFGLDKKLFKRSDYDQFMQESAADPKDTVYPYYLADAKEKFPELTDEEIEDAFNEEFGLLENETSWKFKRGNDRLKNAAAEIINKKYEKIVNAEKVYDGVQKNMSSAKTYSEQVDATLTKVPKVVSVTLDGQTYTEEIPAEFIKTAKANYLSSEMMQTLMAEDGKIDADFLIQDLLTDFRGSNFNKLVESIAKKHAQFLALNDKSGRRNMSLKDEEINIADPKQSSNRPKGESDRLLEEAAMATA